MGGACDRGPSAGQAFWRALAPLALLLGLVTNAAAANDEKICMQAYKQALNEASASVEEACASYIKSGRARDKLLAAAYYVRASSLMLRGEYDHALQEQNEAIRLWPDSPSYRRQRGEIYTYTGDYVRALVDLDDAVRSDPNNAQFHNWRGYAYEMSRDYDRAIAEFTLAIKLDPKNANIYGQRCGVFFLKGEYDRALPDCDESIRRDPKSGGRFGYTRRCQVYVAIGEIDRALRDCDQEVRSNPQSISGHVWRGFIYEQKDEFAKSIADYQQALAINPAGKNVQIPPAIGQTIEDVRPHLAQLQGPAAAGADRVALPQTQGDARAILEKRGLLGAWAANCAAAPSPDNAYTVYRAIDGRRVQRDVMASPTQRIEAGIIESAAEAGSDIAYTQAGETRDEMRLRTNGNRMRIVDVTRNGVQVIANGIYLPPYGIAVLTGKETPWANKCAPSTASAAADQQNAGAGQQNASVGQQKAPTDQKEKLNALYRLIIETVDNMIATAGEIKGQRIDYSGKKSPKALVACFNWRDASPTRYSGGSYVRTGSSANPPASVDAAVAEATNNCKATCNATCVLADRNGQNTLQPPPDW